MKSIKRKHPPLSFRPLLWFLRWDEVDIGEDKEDIIVNTINDGALSHWRWIIKTYGKPCIQGILAKRLGSEFNPESKNLAKIIFSIPHFRYVRKCSYKKNS
jgi:hypothetical protein